MAFIHPRNAGDHRAFLGSQIASHIEQGSKGQASFAGREAHDGSVFSISVWLPGDIYQRICSPLASFSLPYPGFGGRCRQFPDIWPFLPLLLPLLLRLCNTLIRTFNKPQKASERLSTSGKSSLGQEHQLAMLTDHLSFICNLRCLRNYTSFYPKAARNLPNHFILHVNGAQAKLAVMHVAAAECQTRSYTNMVQAMDALLYEADAGRTHKQGACQVSTYVGSCCRCLPNLHVNRAQARYASVHVAAAGRQISTSKLICSLFYMISMLYNTMSASLNLAAR